MWLPWTYAAAAAAMLGLLTRVSRDGRPLLRWRPLMREVAIISALYALWIRASDYDPVGTVGGLARGRQVAGFERAVGLLQEGPIQRIVLPHRLLVQFSNLYYGGVHVPAMGVFLVWMFARHRGRLAVWRTTLALTTAACLVIRYLPVAPPRFYPQMGFVDTADLYHQSVYGPPGTGVSGQFAAMPSVHVAWAVLIGIACVRVSTSRWRWLGVLHAALTVFVVTDTANHWLLDGVAGAALLLPAFVIARRVSGDRSQRSALPEHGDDDREAERADGRHRVLSADASGQRA